MSEFSMSKSMRNQIEKKGLYNVVMKKQSNLTIIMMAIGAVITVSGIFYLIFSGVADYGFDSDEFIFTAVGFGILGLVPLLNGFFSRVINKRKEKSRIIGLGRLEFQEKRSAAVILEEITEEIKNNDGKISASENMGFFSSTTPAYFTKNWYIAPDFERFIKYTDIVTVVGIMKKGTFVVSTHGDVIYDMFGGNPNWGKLFDIIKNKNPHVMYHDEIIIVGELEKDIHTLINEVTSSTPLIHDGEELRKKREKVVEILVETFEQKRKNAIVDG